MGVKKQKMQMFLGGGPYQGEVSSAWWSVPFPSTTDTDTFCRKSLQEGGQINPRSLPKDISRFGGSWKLEIMDFEGRHKNL